MYHPYSYMTQQAQAFYASRPEYGYNTISSYGYMGTRPPLLPSSESNSRTSYEYPVYPSYEAQYSQPTGQINSYDTALQIAAAELVKNTPESQLSMPISDRGPRWMYTVSKPDIDATSPTVIQAKSKFIVKLSSIDTQQTVQSVNSEMVAIEQQQYNTQNNVKSEDNSSVIELIVERIISATHNQQQPMTIGSIFRYTLECLSSGLLLPDGPGLLNPCQNEPKNALDCLTIQQKEDITYTAQLALRMMVFGQIYKILDMEVFKSETNIDYGRKRPYQDDDLGRELD
ncbi:unnamed protein product [Didymodactylos carnosus]|uniref:DZF domain-containing protein n=1 Tax=Didymodactylos carnosus TaxID=1234261 RepID=A0A813YRT1_9BILA|nr:unnamed protein product [Didymodactylos carnosus]CAF3673481.1 unnamed protein product [Didymodactylos carnosus]